MAVFIIGTAKRNTFKIATFNNDNELHLGQNFLVKTEVIIHFIFCNITEI